MADETPELSRSDVALIGQAVRQRWPIPEAQRPVIVTQMIAIVHGSDSDRNRVSAAKVLQAMDKANLEQERRDEKIPDYHEHALSSGLEAALAKVYGNPSA